jgi:hypothetical protein
VEQLSELWVRHKASLNSEVNTIKECVIITYKVVKLSEGHLCANIFALRDEGDNLHYTLGYF